jgi:hypothetical protein
MADITDIPTHDIRDTFNAIMEKEPPSIANTDALLFEYNSWNEELCSSLSKLLRIILYYQGITKNKFIQMHNAYSVSKNYPKKTIDHERFNIMRNLNSKDITIRFFEKIIYHILGFKLENIVFSVSTPDDQRLLFGLNEPHVTRKDS